MIILKRILNYLFPVDMFEVGYRECMDDLMSGECDVKAIQDYLDSILLSGNYSKYDMGVRAAMNDYDVCEPVICPDCFSASAPGTVKCNYCGRKL